MLKSLEQGNPHSTIWVEKLTPHFFLSPTDSAEIENIISQLKNGKSVGPFSIPSNLLKMLNKFISPILALLINESFSAGVFPDKLKIAKVIALHKKVQLIALQITDPFPFCLLSAKFLKK